MSTTKPETMKPPNISLPFDISTTTTNNSITATTIMPPNIQTQPSSTIQTTTTTTATINTITPQTQIIPTPFIAASVTTIPLAPAVAPVATTIITTAATAATTTSATIAATTTTAITTPNIIPPPMTNNNATTLPALNLTQVQQAPLALLKPITFKCSLLDNGIRCDRAAGNASFSAKIAKQTKGINIALDPTVRHTYICEHHKSIIAVAKKATTIAREPQVRQVNKVAYAHVNQTGGGDQLQASSSGGVDVDLQQLQVNTLRRYKRHFRVQTRPGLNKMQLAESLKGHFRTLPIIEKEAITYFVYIVKCYRNKLDHNPKEFD